ncbi:hypothetical protein AAFF_G00180710 [Aldrovandia affinis]|uniref:Uncharacterized protein n=1 Tax=Aldrovandia affinis TaxID=143900 RepID=A0AAD7T0D3_9TELE|nr:hypothetical protein AAFF_G00180710 [Aldrovandia affinis]
MRSSPLCVEKDVRTRIGKAAGVFQWLRNIWSVAMDWVPEGGKRKSGRPKMMWRHTFKEDLSEMGVSWHGARRVASDQCRWRGLIAQCSSRNGRNKV